MASVVIIEDEETQSQTLTEILEHAGHEVTAFADPEKALDTVDFAEIDLLVTDLAMPMRGELVIHTVRSSGFTVPIIVVSGVLKYGDDIDLETIGVDRVLSKPLDIKLLLRYVEELLQLDR